MFPNAQLTLSYRFLLIHPGLHCWRPGHKRQPQVIDWGKIKAKSDSILKKMEFKKKERLRREKQKTSQLSDVASPEPDLPEESIEEIHTISELAEATQVKAPEEHPGRLGWANAREYIVATLRDWGKMGPIGVNHDPLVGSIGDLILYPQHNQVPENMACYNPIARMYAINITRSLAFLRSTNGYTPKDPYGGLTIKLPISEGVLSLPVTESLSRIGRGEIWDRGSLDGVELEPAYTTHHGVKLELITDF